ncbi:uncharacterized protein N7484_001518 [Penicillium longicatenatum]|uniref:uncharacterized protein n=1 Tax=Penicillium longicatenatum TaxID=1561947 RepID=UPI0025485780|nr:uncharacterized protein N7484_001518 [Penicillium longicatenatum]KAJ5657869.1 hypothetical protein N7484_001518 [Penicillium longicatenatum]
MGHLLIRGWVLAALAVQGFATVTLTSTAEPVVTVQPTATPTPQAHHHQHHHWTYISRALPSRKPCSTHSSSVPSSKATPASSAKVVSSSSVAISVSTPYSRPVTTHSVHHHHHHNHWTYTSLPRPHRTQCSSSTPISILSSSAPSSTPLYQTTAKVSVPGSVASGKPQPSGGIPAPSGSPLPDATGAPTGSEAQSTTSTIVSTRTATITACPSATPNCPPSSKTTFVTTETVVVSTTVCPVADATQTTSFPAGGQASVKPEGPEFTTSTVFSTRTATITACPSSVTNCPARSKTTLLTTETIAVSTTVCPVAEATQITTPSIPGGEAPTKSEELGFTTSTVFSTRTATITACPSSVTDCPARSKTAFVTTETIAVSTTVRPITEAAGATQTSSVSASIGESAGFQGNGDEGSDSNISTIWTTRISTITACPASVTNCPLRSKTTYLTTETLAVGTTTYAAPAQATSSSEGLSVTAPASVVDSQATKSVTTITTETASGPSGSTGGQSGSGAATMYTALYTVESCGNSGTCTEYVETVVMTQTSVAQPTMTFSMFKPVYGSGAAGIPTASASSAHVGQQASQSSGLAAHGSSSTSSAAYAVYTGAASGSLQWSLLKIFGTAMVMLVALLA